MKSGNIILLYGTSGSGKSALTRALQGLIKEPCFHLDLDLFHQTTRKLSRVWQWHQPFPQKTRAGMGAWKFVWSATRL